ncbi:hypothetical protein D9M68_138720 [compost metagenome]
MERFAKLYEFEGIGQVLVKLDSGDSGPEVRFFFSPPGLGVCSLAVNFQGDEDGQWDAAEMAFDMVDEAKAKDMVEEALKTIPAGLAG